MIRSMLAATTALGAALIYQPAFAADEQGPKAASESVAIEEVLVTAQHRSESLQKTALSVNAVDAAALKSAGVVQPQDLTKLIPALQLSALGGSGTQVTIRGVGNFAPFIYNEPAVAVNYDGVYLARSAAPNGLFFDLERVEVLKGPQGTLYGRNATGGAINVISKKPSPTGYAASGDLELGNYNLRRGSLAVNIPVADNAALRLSGQAVKRDGYLSDGYLDDDGQAVRAQFLVTPNEKLRVLLAADYIHQGGQGAGGVFIPASGYLTSDPYSGPSSASSNAILTGASLGISHGTDPNLLPKIGNDGSVDLKIWGASATIDYDLGFAALTFIPAYRKTDNQVLQYAGGFPVHSKEHSEQTSAELRLASAQADAPLKWVAGLYYFSDQSTLVDDVEQGVTFAATNVPHLPVTSAAVFGQATYSLTDRFRVTGGLRYTREKKEQRGTIVTALPPVPATFPAPAIVYYTNVACPAPGVVNVAAHSCTAGFSGELESKKMTWKAGLEFDATETSLLFLGVETGFKAGGFYPSTAPNTFQPEEIRAVTLGSKNRFFENRLQLNLDVFDWSYDNKQVTHLGPIRPGGYTLITENAGKATIRGLEVDLQWRPTARDRISANVQYLKTRYDAFTYTVPLLSSDATAAATGCPQTVATPAAGPRIATVNCAGRAMPATPKSVLNLSYGHTFGLPDGQVDAVLGTKIQSSYYTGEEYLPGQFQKASMVSYANATYRPESGGWSVGAYVENIEDEAVKSSSFVQLTVGLPVVVLRPPRTYGVRLGFEF